MLIIENSKTKTIRPRKSQVKTNNKIHLRSILLLVLLSSLLLLCHFFIYMSIHRLVIRRIPNKKNLKKNTLKKNTFKATNPTQQKFKLLCDGQKIFQPERCCRLWFKAMTGMAAGKHRRRDREEREEIAYQSPSVYSGMAVPSEADRRRCKTAEVNRSVTENQPWFSL